MSEPEFAIHAIPITDYTDAHSDPFPQLAADEEAETIAGR